MQTDFREQIAAATLQNLERLGSQRLLDLGESGCVPLPGGRRWLAFMDMSHALIALGCLLLLATSFVLFLLELIPQNTFHLVTLCGLGVVLIIRKVKASIMKACLARRADNLMKAASVRTSRPVGIEDAKTLRKKKLVIEDRGICIFDFEQRRLLIEGCAYRYVIYARDVFSVEAIFGYATSGALLKCRMAGQALGMALKTDGMGPVASLIQSFNPEAGANELAQLVNETLFGVKRSVYRQSELPPPLASA
jgi:hypothetical protein